MSWFVSFGFEMWVSRCFLYLFSSDTQHIYSLHLRHSRKPYSSSCCWWACIGLTCACLICGCRGLSCGESRLDWRFSCAGCNGGKSRRGGWCLRVWCCGLITPHDLAEGVNHTHLRSSAGYVGNHVKAWALVGGALVLEFTQYVV